MTAQEVIDKIKHLRRITQETGCITRRAQSELLASLSNELMLEVAGPLNQIFQTEGNRNDSASRTQR